MTYCRLLRLGRREVGAGDEGSMLAPSTRGESHCSGTPRVWGRLLLEVGRAMR
jgi:hypothetical protein